MYKINFEQLLKDVFKAYALLFRFFCLSLPLKTNQVCSTYIFLIMTSVALNNLWTYIDGLSLKKKDREWLADKLLETHAEDAKTAQQKAYVKESLTRALKEVEEAKKKGRKMMTEEEFIEGLKKDGLL